MLDSLIADEQERAHHIMTIHWLAEQSGLPAVEVERIYAMELRRFETTTRVREFLPLLVGRQVQLDIKERDTGKGGRHP
jgi:hypothetical protein